VAIRNWIKKCYPVLQELTADWDGLFELLLLGKRLMVPDEVFLAAGEHTPPHHQPYSTPSPVPLLWL